MNNPAPSACQDRGFAPPRIRTPGKRARKNFSAKIPRNPLISLDSDERIQGNPRKSNPHKRRSSQRNGQEPRKSKRSDRTNVASPLRQRTHTDSIQRRSALGDPVRSASCRKQSDKRTSVDELGNGAMTMPGDIPRLSSAEIAATLAAHRAAPAFTIVPAHDDLGSNTDRLFPTGCRFAPIWRRQLLPASRCGARPRD